MNWYMQLLLQLPEAWLHGLAFGGALLAALCLLRGALTTARRRQIDWPMFTGLFLSMFLSATSAWAADTKITALTAVGTAAGTDIIPVVQGGVNKQETAAQLLTNEAHAGYSDYSAIADPSTPGSGVGRLYFKQIPPSGRVLPKWIGPSGIDVVVQPALFGNNIIMWAPLSGTTCTGAGASFGATWNSAGTCSTPTPASTNISTQIKKQRWANVVTTTNQELGVRFNAVTERQFWRGNAAGLGGFFFFARFTTELVPAATIRIFAGLTGNTSTAVVISDTVINDTAGLWHDTTDSSTTFNFVTRNTATTTKQAISLSNAIAAGNLYDFYMWCAPNGSTIYWRLDDVTNSVTYSNNTGTTLPTSTTFLQPQVAMSNGTANTTVTTTALGLNRIYVESDH